MCYENDHTDSEFARREYDSEVGNVTRESVEDARWERWCNEVEKLLGIETLDGDQLEDGYSLDFALDHYEDRETPEQYAEIVRRAWADLAEPQ